MRPRKTKKCRHSEGPFHDCAYVEWRTGFIPFAEAIANRKHGATIAEDATADDKETWSFAWDATFLSEMGRLTNEPFNRAQIGPSVFVQPEKQTEDEVYPRTVFRILFTTANAAVLR